MEEIIRLYINYLRNRSNCREYKILYNNESIEHDSYVNLLKNEKNLFFIIRIGETVIVYYWKECKMNRMNILYNTYTDDGIYINEYDDLEEIDNNLVLIDSFNKLQLKKSVQTPVILRGEIMEMPEPFTYNEIKVKAFPNNLLNGCTRINNRSLFEIESKIDGIHVKMSINYNSSFLNVGGIIDKFKSNLLIIQTY